MNAWNPIVNKKQHDGGKTEAKAFLRGNPVLPSVLKRFWLQSGGGTECTMLLIRLQIHH